jgi:CoA:oxalate CoA-transferase
MMELLKMAEISEAMQKKGGVLKGLRAIEWATFGNGAIIGVILADLGAEIIKLEEPGVGDPARGIRELYGVRAVDAQGHNLLFEGTNRNKKSLTLDLKTQKGKDLIYKLIAKSDIFYTNYNTSMAKKVGMDYETLSKYNPRLIYGHAAGLGDKGPDSEKRAFDPVGLARSGMMSSTGERNEPPGQIVGAIVDTMGATMTAFGIVAALFGRERLNAGQYIEASLLGSAIWAQFANVQLSLLCGHAMKRHLRPESKNPISNQYKCEDGRWLTLAEPQSDRFWGQFCSIMGLDSLSCPDYSDWIKRKEHCTDLIAVLDKAFATRTRDEWLAHFKNSNAKFAYESIQDIVELKDDPQVKANGYIVDYDHPTLGAIKLSQFPIGFSKTRTVTPSPAPEFGQHTEEILLDIGYTWDDIASLRSENII